MQEEEEDGWQDEVIAAHRPAPPEHHDPGHGWQLWEVQRAWCSPPESKKRTLELFGLLPGVVSSTGILGVGTNPHPCLMSLQAPEIKKLPPALSSFITTKALAIGHQSQQ